MDIVFATNFFRYGKPYNPPAPLQKSGGNYKKLLLKSPFGKGGFRGNTVHLRCRKFFVILSGSKYLVIMRFFGRSTPSE
jgi:hypothetical protein